MRPASALFDVWRDLERRHRLWCGYALIALLATGLGWSVLAARTNRLEHRRAAREAVLKELMPLKIVYLTAKSAADVQTGKAAATLPDDSPARIIDEIGIKGTGVKITPLKGGEHNGFMEDAADVRIEGLTANETFNLLYRLEKGSRPVILKKANLRVRFDDPSRFDLALVFALLRPVAGTSR